MKPRFAAFCDNKKSFAVCEIAIKEGRKRATLAHGKTLVLVPCNRLDHKDNQRGANLAGKIADMLNALPEAEITKLTQVLTCPLP